MTISPSTLFDYIGKRCYTPAFTMSRVPEETIEIGPYRAGLRRYGEYSLRLEVWLEMDTKTYTVERMYATERDMSLPFGYRTLHYTSWGQGGHMSVADETKLRLYTQPLP